MRPLAVVFTAKIALTVLFWCLPLILLPAEPLQALGIPISGNLLFLRLLGWAYLSLCVGYGFGLHAAIHGQRAPGPIWVGIVSNGGACAWLLYFALQGTWSNWSGMAPWLLWASLFATALITFGLYWFGVHGSSVNASVKNDLR